MYNTTDLLEELLMTLTGLQMGTFDASWLVSFADEAISYEEEVDSLWIDISLCGRDKSRIADTLSPFIASHKENIQPNKMLSILYHLFKKETINIEKTVTLMDRFISELIFENQIVNKTHYFNDQYHLISNQSINQTMQELERAVENFLSLYGDDRLDLKILKTAS